MPEYRVVFEQTLTIGVMVQADDLDEAIELAYDKAPSGICASCSGWDQHWYREEAGELGVAEVIESATDRVVWEKKYLPALP